MPRKGSGKQVPADQSSRGQNREHAEGQANARNTDAKKGGTPAPPPKRAR